MSIRGIVEIASLFWLENTIEDVEGVRPYSLVAESQYDHPFQW